MWVVFVFLGLFLLSSNLGRRQSWNPVEQIIVELTAPIQQFIHQTVRVTEGIWLKYFGLINLRNENLGLKKEVEALRMENARFREMLATQKRLRELLQFKETIHWPVLAVQVIGRDPSGWFESVIIDKGSNAGLKMNMPVVNAMGVVGRLVSVSPNYAKVLLIIDQNSAVDSIVQRTREKGILKGFSSKFCKLDYVLRNSHVTPGDMIITSGLGRVFPKGLPVGMVVDEKNVPGAFFKEIRVRPMVDFTKLEELLIILKEDPLSPQNAKKE